MSNKKYGEACEYEKVEVNAEEPVEPVKEDEELEAAREYASFLEDCLKFQNLVNVATAMHEHGGYSFKETMQFIDGWNPW